MPITLMKKSRLPLISAARIVGTAKPCKQRVIITRLPCLGTQRPNSLTAAGVSGQVSAFDRHMRAGRYSASPATTTVW